jgi:hypothetical protein
MSQTALVLVSDPPNDCLSSVWAMAGPMSPSTDSAGVSA